MSILILGETTTLLFSMPVLLILLERNVVSVSFVSFMIMIQVSVLSLMVAEVFEPNSPWRLIGVALSLAVLFPGIMLTSRLLRRSRGR